MFGTNSFSSQDVLNAAEIAARSGSGLRVDAAGTVRHVGSHVTDLAPGDRVIVLGSEYFSTSVTVARKCCA